MKTVAPASTPVPTILIVDDESAIRKSLSAVFVDEGFQVRTAESGEEALELVRAENPSLVLLDIWMPGLDGIETLRLLKDISSTLPIVMMSGHATIATAIRATRLGAFDFIEKPLDLDVILHTVKRALGLGVDLETIRNQDDVAVELKGLSLGGSSPTVLPQAFSGSSLRGRKMRQRTLSRSAVLYGQGLHSGNKSGLILEPLPPNSGIHFMGVSDGAPVPAHVDYVGSTGFATTIKLGRTQAGTIEHLMSALHAYGLSNLLIKCNGEVPVMDGSSLEFCSLIEEVGIDEQNAEWFAIRPTQPITVESGREFIHCEPAESFTIDYTLEYPAPVGRQRLVFELRDVEAYKQEIAPARTFGLVRDIGALQRQGLALGGRFDNFVLIGDDGALNCELRFTDEPVRHKILDAIGDLFLLGRTLDVKITAQMTGHSDNIQLLRRIREQLVKTAP